MRKHDEGYALVLVLVVMVVVCLVAVSIMTVSVENLQDQQDSVSRMQDKYEVQGKLERVVMLAEADFSHYAGFSMERLESICEEVGGVEIDGDFAYAEDVLEEFDTLAFQLSAQSGSVKIECCIMITGDIEKAMLEEMYTIKDYVVSYSSYEITNVQSEEGGAA